MLNRAPIFINAFSRGGSNILWNVFLTHPDVCSPIIETLSIFRTGRAGRLAGYRAAWLTRQPNFFNQKRLKPRRPISPQAQRFIDRTLYEWKLKTVADEDMRYKYEDEVYTLEEAQAARLAAKNNNGLAFLSDILMAMYPDATFFALVKNPAALYESHRRVKFVRSVGAFIELYQRIAERMAQDASRYENYHIVRFEDLLARPEQTIRWLYEKAGLDAGKVRKMRFKAKRHYTADGVRQTDYEVERHYWFAFDELDTYLEPNINRFHIDQLDKSDSKEIQRRLAPIIPELGYAATESDRAV